MSMLSSQVDELRELATRYDELQVGAVKAVTMPSNMGSILREAADTIWELRDDLQRANAENAKLRERVDAAHMSRLLTENENAKLREQMERLVTLLRADCDIEASWDGLRKFWSIGLTENGCLMRDRACKAEAENAKLRELIGAGTCEADETDLIPFVRADSGDFEVDYIHVMECTECGHTYEHVNGDYEYCPRCGRKRKDVDA